MTRKHQSWDFEPEPFDSKPHQGWFPSLPVLDAVASLSSSQSSPGDLRPILVIFSVRGFVTASSEVTRVLAHLDPNLPPSSQVPTPPAGLILAKIHKEAGKVSGSRSPLKTQGSLEGSRPSFYLPCPGHRSIRNRGPSPLSSVLVPS